MNKRESRKSGFTLIELSFAIAFISVLLITITLITNEIVSLYRRGYSMKAVNQVGRDLIDDFTAAITGSPTVNIVSTFCNGYDTTNKEDCAKDSGQKAVYHQYYTTAHIENSGSNYSTVPLGGVFCTGRYSYVWNTGYVLGSSSSAYSKPDGNAFASSDRLSIHIPRDLLPADVDTGNLPSGWSFDGTDGYWIENFRLLKFEDTSRAICTFPITNTDGSHADRNYSKTDPVRFDDSHQGFEITYPLETSPIELISASDSSLALYDMVVFTPAQVSNTNRLFYSASFILGTLDGSVDIMTASDFCKTPDTYQNLDFSYCAVNKFNFSTQASGV